MPKLIRRAESCENCGRDLPISEICQYCGHDNHQLVLGGYACKRIHNEIEVERAAKGELWQSEDAKDGKKEET